VQRRGHRHGRDPPMARQAQAGVGGVLKTNA